MEQGRADDDGGVGRLEQATVPDIAGISFTMTSSTRSTWLVPWSVYAGKNGSELSCSTIATASVNVTTAFSCGDEPISSRNGAGRASPVTDQSYVHLAPGVECRSRATASTGRWSPATLTTPAGSAPRDSSTSTRTKSLRRPTWSSGAAAAGAAPWLQARGPSGNGTGGSGDTCSRDPSAR
jgi:hypothetical protein